MTDCIPIPRWAVAQLALHTRLAAHHAASTGTEPAAAEAILAWAILVASGGGEEAPAPNAMPTTAEVHDDPTELPAYLAAADQAEQLATHFDQEELFEVAALYGKALSVIEGKIKQIESRGLRP